MTGAVLLVRFAAERLTDVLLGVWRRPRTYFGFTLVFLHKLSFLGGRR